LLLARKSGHRQIREIEDEIKSVNNELDYLIVDMKMRETDTDEHDNDNDEDDDLFVYKFSGVQPTSKILIFKNYFYSNNGIDFSHMSGNAEMASTTLFDSDSNSNILATSPTTIITVNRQTNVLCLLQDGDGEMKLKWPRSGKDEQIHDIQWFDYAKGFLISTRKQLYLLTIYEAAPTINTKYVVHRIINEKTPTTMGSDQLSCMTVFNHFIILAFNNNEKHRPSYLTRLLLCTSKKTPSTTTLSVPTAMEKQKKLYSTRICSKTEYTLSDESIECLCANQNHLCVIVSTSSSKRSERRLEIRDSQLKLKQQISLDDYPQVVNILNDHRSSFILLLQQRLISFDENGFICFYDLDEQQTILNGIVHKQNYLLLLIKTSKSTTKQLKLFDLVQKY